VSKQENLKSSKKKVGLRTENTIMNHMIKKWAHQGIFKDQEVLFEDDLLNEKSRF
jgi:hypothetical protein